MERGVDEKRARSIIGSQMPIEEKRKLADHVIDNSGSLEATREQVNNFWREIHL
jgi:dephospho-CoA kinase